MASVKTLEQEAEEFKKKKVTTPVAQKPQELPVTTPKENESHIRDIYASAALTGLLAVGRDRVIPEDILREAFKYADMAVIERKKKAD